CHSRCSVIHPVGDHNHRSYFFKIRNLLLEWSGQLIFLGLSGRSAMPNETFGPIVVPGPYLPLHLKKH
ncbi:MAG: hypothetical protein P8179_07985, partial [Candidatus Thiodiazotropha sp.]